MLASPLYGLWALHFGTRGDLQFHAHDLHILGGFRVYATYACRMASPTKVEIAHMKVEIPFVTKKPTVFALFEIGAFPGEQSPLSC